MMKPFRAPLRFATRLSQVIDWSVEAGRSDRRAVFRTRNELYDFIHQEKVGGERIDYLEFGVWTGDSFHWWLDRNAHPRSRFVGFDTFGGLPAAWAYQKSHFDSGGRPPRIVDPRASFHVGLFQNTLGHFVQQHEMKAPLVVNIDTGPDSSTLFVLATLGARLKRGDIIIFDEFLTWRTPTDQCRAFIDFASSFCVDYRFLGAARRFEKVAVEVVAPAAEGGRGRRISSPTDGQHTAGHSGFSQTTRNPGS